MARNYWKIILLLIVITSAGLAHAYTEQTVGDNLTADVSSNNPAPYDQVNVNLSSFSYDLNRTNISWIVNGKQVASGYGQKSFTFTMGPVGSITTLLIVAETPSGDRTEKTLTFTSAQVLLSWHAQTYTPPLYRGHSLPTSESPITVTAIPSLVQGKTTISPDKLVYTWTIDGRTVNSASGYGRSSFNFTSAKIFGSNNVGVVVDSLDGSVRATAAITIPIYKPKIVFYLLRPLAGVFYQTALPSPFHFTSNDITVKAEPYYFSTADVQSGHLTYSWDLSGGEAKPESEDPSIMDVHRDNGIEGGASLNLAIDNSGSILQSINNSVELTYGEH